MLDTAKETWKMMDAARNGRERTLGKGAPATAGQDSTLLFLGALFKGFCTSGAHVKRERQRKGKD
jgi:hypothetical protein